MFNHQKKRFVVLVLDGLGVGAMSDVAQSRPQDQGSHTLKHVIESDPVIRLRNLENLGVHSYFINPDHPFQTSSTGSLNVALGRAKLAHFGADSYVGHQEIAGTKPRQPIRQFVRDVKEEIMQELRKQGFQAKFSDKVIIVEEHIAIADNIETDYGLNINVVGSLDHYPFEHIEKIGRAVRKVVKVGRVITMGGKGITQTDLFKHFSIQERDGYTAWGINIPALNIYNEYYQVIHMGYGISSAVQAPQILRDNNVPVTLIGKAADVIQADGATYLPHVYTDGVVDRVNAALDTMPFGFIFANIQETDLAGHQQDTAKYLSLLQRLDNRLPEILRRLAPDDILVITGDHGNDPTIGHTNHTRELTPVITVGQKIPSSDLGERTTLADIGTTVAAYFSVPQPESGDPLEILT